MFAIEGCPQSADPICIKPCVPPLETAFFPKNLDMLCPVSVVDWRIIATLAETGAHDLTFLSYFWTIHPGVFQ